MLLFTLLGCAEGDLLPTVTVTDSAGVTVVDHTTEHMQRLASLALQGEPVFQLGTD